MAAVAAKLSKSWYLEITIHKVHEISIFGLLSPSIKPHIHKSGEASPPLQMVLGWNFAPFGIKSIDIQKVSWFFTSPRSRTLVHESSNTFAHSCTWANNRAKEVKWRRLQVPSTATHSNNTCPDVRARGFSRIPQQAGHQNLRAYPGLGALLPIGTWSMIHRFNTLKKEIKIEIEAPFKVARERANACERESWAAASKPG